MLSILGGGFAAAGAKYSGGADNAVEFGGKVAPRSGDEVGEQKRLPGEM